MNIVEDITVRPRETEVLRLLRRGKKEKDPGDFTLGLVREALAEARPLAHPKAVYDFFDRPDVPDHPVFLSARRVGLCICTIGSDLEKRVGDLMARGELARGVVLDAVGSEMAETAAQVLDRRMESEHVRSGERAGARFSPGYGEWELEGQQWLFEVLDAGRIGVELSSSMMMTPRKSVSFAINLGVDPKPPRCTTPCDQCDMNDCEFRRDPSV